MNPSAPNPYRKPILTALAMLVLMGANVVLSAACRGHAWSLFAVLPLAIAQAGLLAFAAMDLASAGPVPRVYLGLALILMGVAALSFTDFATRTSALPDPPAQREDGR